MDANVNLAQCLQTASYIGHTHYVNVCNGKEFDIPWGSVDWLGAIVLGGAIGGLGLFMAFLFLMMIMDGI